MSIRMNLLLALACGLILGNLYYAQPILAAISAGMPGRANGRPAGAVPGKAKNK